MGVETSSEHNNLENTEDAKKLKTTKIDSFSSTK